MHLTNHNKVCIIESMEKQTDYLTDFDKNFSSEKQCLDYLFGLRWLNGYNCPRCYHDQYWQIGEKKYKCRKCGYQTTVTAGTIFQDSHVPLTVWLRAIWLACHETGVTNAKVLQQQLELGSYRTAWTMLQKIRKVMGDCNPAKLGGVISVNRVSTHKKSTSVQPKLVVAAEVQADGTIRNICIDTDEEPCDGYYLQFMKSHAKPGSIIVEHSYSPFLLGRPHNSPFKYTERYPYPMKAEMESATTVTQQLKQMGLLGSLPLLCSTEQLRPMLDECSYKFNRRTQSGAERFEEILYSAVRTEPLPYHEIVMQNKNAVFERH